MAMHDYLNEPLQKPVFSNHNLQCTENIICSLPPYFTIYYNNNNNFIKESVIVTKGGLPRK